MDPLSKQLRSKHLCLAGKLYINKISRNHLRTLRILQTLSHCILSGVYGLCGLEVVRREGEEVGEGGSVS